MAQSRESGVCLDDGTSTNTSSEQELCESSILPLLKEFWESKSPEKIKLIRESHCEYLRKHLCTLSSGFKSLDASQAWIGYWILHSLELLGDFPQDRVPQFIEFFKMLQSPSGGFGGGPLQTPHLAPTYASINTIMTIGTEEAYSLVDRKRMYHFLMSLKQPDGSFVMHLDGECDVRGTYCAISVASVLNILTPELIENTSNFVKRCQTYEGGIGAYPFSEAHGGYTFCGLATMSLLGKLDELEIDSLLYWLVRRQMTLEGGFQGRINKLVDGCYSFWQGGCFLLLQEYLDTKGISVSKSKGKNSPDHIVDEGSWFFNQQGLQEYILLCCQEEEGGLKDKPEKYRDFYHTCYCLSGLSISQHNLEKDRDIDSTLGGQLNLVAEIDPRYNVSKQKSSAALDYFSKLPKIE